MTKPVVHDLKPHEDAILYEYELPLLGEDIQPEHKTLLDTWFTSLLGKSPLDVQQLLKGQWARLTFPPVQQFAFSLSDRIPRSIILSKADARLVLEDPSDPDNMVCIRSPSPLSPALRQLIESYSVPPLVEFLTNFRGVRESKLMTVDQIPIEPCKISANSEEYGMGSIGDWDGALYIYYILAGNMMLMRQGGAVAMWDHEFGWGGGNVDEVMHPVASSFEEFLSTYAKYLSAGEAGRRGTLFY